MDNLKLDYYLEIVNEEKTKKGLDNYVPLYPMLRVIDNKLYVGVMLTKKNADVWNKDSNIKPEFWVLIDAFNNNIVEFNETKAKDFVIGDLKKKAIKNKQKEISKYEVAKKIQYKEYLMNDIKNDNLPIQQKLANVLNNEIEIDGEKININDYIMANIEEDITNKINELVDLVVVSKYSSITFYYERIYKQIINTYKKANIIDRDKIKLCLEVMNNYYDGVIGIDNFFNL